MTQTLSYELLKRFARASIALSVVLLVGSGGYWILSGARSSLIDCAYMTFITVTTIGFTEVVDLSDNPAGRIFTIAIALSGIATATYLLSSLTAFVVEGELTETFRRRTMEKKAKDLEDHYIVCGAGKVGSHIVHELKSTRRPCVVIDPQHAHLDEIAKSVADLIYLNDDATDNDVLLAAGIKKAWGLFAATDDDNRNLVIALTAKQLNPDIMVVARCGELKNVEKMKTAGANAVISPSFIGGLRMASEMIRPTVVSFLDTMLRDRDRNLRIEEIPASLPGTKIADLDLSRFRDTLLLAVRTTTEWVYNPLQGQVLDADSRLIVMTTPKERAELERHVRDRQAGPA